MTPRATVRLQLTREFGFDAARATIDYYAALGLSHFYLSPIFRACAGSTHGYDTIDFRHVSDELGGRAAFERLAQALRERGMGIVLDIVPNHMGVASNDNAWWNDVLAHGAQSRYARYFDIDWRPDDPALHGKLLLPFLAQPPGELLAAGGLALQRDGAQACIACGVQRWPLSPESVAELGDAGDYDARDAAGRERLQQLLERQHYRLDSWRSAATRINYRRFFNIAELAALRVEDAVVFEDVHREIFALYAQGLIDGVRVDHVDGLAYPVEYCAQLRDALEARRAQRPLALRAAPPYIVVEKIFAAHEAQRDWGVAGTTGYDFMDQVCALAHNPAGLAALDLLWRRVSGRPWEWRAAVFEARRQLLDDSFQADLARVVRTFHALAQRVPGAAHLSDAALKRALTELVVAFPVYRSYGLPGALPPEDAAVLAQAGERAIRELVAQDYEALDFVARSLRERVEPAPDAELDTLQRTAAVRFQQLTGPVAAKAIEDTVFYRELRLLSRNEVGSDPNQFALTPDEFHAACAARAQRFPHGLLATATHDHKRGEDARLRLALLSDDAERWSETCTRWMALNAARRPIANGSPAPDAIDETMLYQTLVGCWPAPPPRTADELIHLQRRVAAWWLKALREAKRHSNWHAHNAAYEDACLAFLGAVLETDGAFVRELDALIAALGPAAALCGLTQVLLHLTTPGVPDLYQGCEFWDLSLVDPDNRRAVDYTPRRASLRTSQALPALLPYWPDGRVKQALIARVLAHRRAHAAFYASADHVPIAASGAAAAHVIAFERRAGAARLVAIATRWPLSLARAPLPQPLVPEAAWDDTTLALSDTDSLRDVLHDGRALPARDGVRVGELLREFPLALYFAPPRAA